MNEFRSENYDVKPKINRNFLSIFKSAYFSYMGKRHASDYKLKNTIFISSVPRGGSTWLFESLLELIPNSLGVWEPFCFTGNANSKLMKLGFNSRQFIHPDSKNQEYVDFIKEILTGQVPNLSFNPLKYANLQENEKSFNVLDFLKFLQKKEKYLKMISEKIKNKKHMIIKPVRSNRLLRYLTNNFDIALYILLFRHPCAVVASQLFHGKWDAAKNLNNIKYPVINRPIFEKNPWLKEILKEVNTPEEYLAFTWSLDMLHPLSADKPYPWHCLTYEDLVVNGVKELHKIFEKLNIQISEKEIDSVLQIPSSTTKDDSNVIQGGNKLATWKKRLSQKEIENILKITHLFGLDFYDENLEPDRFKLKNWKPKLSLEY